METNEKLFQIFGKNEIESKHAEFKTSAVHNKYHTCTLYIIYLPKEELQVTKMKQNV